MAWLRNGVLQPDTGFTVDDVNYPTGWIANNSQSERDKLNITVAPEPQPHDQRFSWGWKDDGTENWKDLDVLKTIWKEEQSDTAKKLLSDSDWLVVRKAEAGTAIPSATSTYRTAVRTSSKTIEDKINACSDLAAFKALFDVPVDSNGKPTGNAPIYDWPKEV